MRARILDTTETAATSTNTPSFNLKYVADFSVQAVTTATAPAAATFTAVAATDLCTAAAHGFLTGLKGQASSTTTLPAGLSASTDYFVIYVSANTFKLASSYANAVAGTVIDITNTGTGTHTFTPTAIAGCTVKVQGSNDDTNYADISGATANITAIGNVIVPVSAALGPYKWARAVLTLTAGQPIVKITASGREREIA